MLISEGGDGACVPGGQWAGLSDTHACAAVLGAGPERKGGSRNRSQSGREAGAPLRHEGRRCSAL